MGLSPSTIYRWEKGKLPSVNELIRLAEMLDKPLNYLAETPERQAEIADLRKELEDARTHLAQLEGKTDAALTGIADILDLLRAAPRESGANAPEVSR